MSLQTCMTSSLLWNTEKNKNKYMVTITDFHCMENKHWHISPNNIFCSPEERKSNIISYFLLFDFELKCDLDIFSWDLPTLLSSPANNRSTICQHTRKKKINNFCFQTFWALTIKTPISESNPAVTPALGGLKWSLIGVKVNLPFA